MREEEAKKKWCPYDESARCIASDCMMWRKTHTGMNNIQFAGDVSEESKARVRANFYNDGYCGLAGAEK